MTTMPAVLRSELGGEPRMTAEEFDEVIKGDLAWLDAQDDGCGLDPVDHIRAVLLRARQEHGAMLEDLQEKAAEAGQWMCYTSPFDPDRRHVVGFCPHGTTGWNGRMDVIFNGHDLADVIARAGHWISEGAK